MQGNRKQTLRPQARTKSAVANDRRAGQKGVDELPQPRFDHLRRLTTHLGVWEHARFTTPRREHGYCTDDNARALVVVCRQPEASASLVELADVYLTFLEQAQLPDGGFHNRRREDGAWDDEVGSDDSQGRALWALGTAATSGPTASMRQTGLGLFARGRDFHSPFPRANAYAVLGAVEVVQALPENEAGLRILERCIGRVPVVPNDSRSPWPEMRLTYDNARIPEALLGAGACLGNNTLVEAGLYLLDWLAATERRAGWFSFVPVGGWAPGEARPGFDQQPIEAAAMADACSRAFSITGDERWRDLVESAARWFIGDNDGAAVLYDAQFGGCRDGLQAQGTNENQGAESTLAALTTLQLAQAIC